MSWAQRSLIAGIIGVGALLVLNRGGGSLGRAGLGPRNSPLKDAVYAAPIPIYDGAKLRDVAGGNYYDDIGGPVTFTSKSWFFEIKDPVEKVAAWYRANLPEGTHPSEAEQGAVSFEWIPPGALEGELVSVTVREGELQIGETVKAGNTGKGTSTP